MQCKRAKTASTPLHAQTRPPAGGPPAAETPLGAAASAEPACGACQGAAAMPRMLAGPPCRTRGGAAPDESDPAASEDPAWPGLAWPAGPARGAGLIAAGSANLGGEARGKTLHG